MTSVTQRAEHLLFLIDGWPVRVLLTDAREADPASIVIVTGAGSQSGVLPTGVEAEPSVGEKAPEPGQEVPQDPPPPPHYPKYPWFPTSFARDMDARGLNIEHQELRVDTTDLPSGQNLFDLDRFIDGVRASIDAELTEVQLTAAEAERWGSRQFAET